MDLAFCCCSRCMLIRLFIHWVNWLQRACVFQKLACVCLLNVGNYTIGLCKMLSYTQFRRGSRCPHCVLWLLFVFKCCFFIFYNIRWWVIGWFFKYRHCWHSGYSEHKTLTQVYLFQQCMYMHHVRIHFDNFLEFKCTFQSYLKYFLIKNILIYSYKIYC